MRKRKVDELYMAYAPDEFRRLAWKAILQAMGQRTVLVNTMIVRSYTRGRGAASYARDTAYNVRGLTILPGSRTAYVTHPDGTRQRILLRSRVQFYYPSDGRPKKPRTFLSIESILATDEPRPRPAWDVLQPIGG